LWTFLRTTMEWSLHATSDSAGFREDIFIGNRVNRVRKQRDK
jgi:hypothetical protein